MEIDGYYIRPDYPQYGNIMFFDDGTWVYFFIKEDLSVDEIKTNLSKSVESWRKNKQIRWGSYWGVYYIQNDTIVIHRYDRRSYLKVWSLSEERYKIINRKHVQRIYYQGILKVNDSSYKLRSPWIYDDNLNFVPADSLPAPDNWLKEEKWMWRSESDWKDYMQKIERKKIKKK